MNTHTTKKAQMCPNPSNPVSLVHIKPNIDPATTTNIQAAGSSSVTTVPVSSDSDIDSKTLSPSRTPQSSNNSIINQEMNDLSSTTIANTFKNIDISSLSIPYNSELASQKRLPASNSHTKLSDLAHKVSDFLFSTRRSIDTSMDQTSNTTTESASPSPVPSRESSYVSLSNLARNGSARTSSTKRKSFLYRPNYSPPRNKNTLSNHNDSGITLNANASSTSLNSTTTGQSVCHFSCNVNNKNTSNNNKSSSKVKETHYVHVKYDPITRKRILNTYEILGDLGSGQHGKVKLAKDIATGEKVAIKIVDRTGKPALMLNRLSRGKAQTQEDKIRKEIAIMKKCDHPHVVKLIEVLDAESSRKIYLVLEYLEKGEIKWQLTAEEILAKIQPTELTLTDCISEPLLKLDQTKKIFRDVVSGLEYLHYQGIIHRDIKPSNLLVGHDDEVKISDFGVSFATNLDGETQDEVELAKTAGTPAFLAPELCGTECKEGMKVTYKIDIWALGVTLYCLVFGCLPFYADSEFQLFQSICHNEVKFPDMARWRVAASLTDDEFDITKDLLLKLLDKNPVTRIEIDEIKKHPFVNWLDEYEKCDSNIKIDVSNEEMDDAVVGLGNRIKKRLTDAFRRRKLTDEKDKSTIDLNDSVSALVKSFPMMGLKDDCSYILSEANDTKGNNSSGINSPNLNCNSHVSLSMFADSSAHQYKPSKSTTCIFSANDQGGNEDPIPKKQHTDCVDIISEDDLKPEEIPLCTSSPGGADDYEIDDAFDNNLSNEQVSDSDEYDYRDELNRNDDNDFKAVKLAVNPSFASLDSFYDDSYSKFMNNNNTSSAASAAYNGFGSYATRNNTPGNARVPSGYYNRVSPNLQPTNSIPVHSNDVRESFSMMKKNSNSPSSGGFMLPGPIQTNMNVLRGAPVRTKASPAQSVASVPSNSLRSPKQAPVNKFPVNPMLNNNPALTSPTNKTFSARGGIKKAVFSNIIDSDSSSDEDSKPIEFSKVKSSSQSISARSRFVPPPVNSTEKPKPRKAFFTSGDDEDNNDNDCDSISLRIDPPVINTQPTPAELIPHENISLPTRSAIYGTRLNLLHREFDNSGKTNESSGSESDDELFLSFGKSNNVPPKSKFNSSSMNNDRYDDSSNSNNDANSISNRKRFKQGVVISTYLSSENIMTLQTPTIVDVPANIFGTQESLNDDDDKSIERKMTDNSRYVVSNMGKVQDEIAILHDDGFDQ